MQTPTSRPSSLQMAPKSSSSTPKVVRKLKITGSDSDSPNPVSKMPKDNKSPKVIDRRSPRNQLITEKKKPTTRISELECQLSHLQDELKKAESLKRKAELEADEAKRHLAATSAELQETRIQLDEISESEDSRLQELRKISHDRDRAWQSELEAVQKQHELQSSALSSAINEIQKLKAELEGKKMSVVKKTEEEADDVELVESLRTKVQNLQAELEAAERSYRDEYIQSTLEIRNAYDLVERAKSESGNKIAELKSMLDESRIEIQELTEKSTRREIESKTLESTLRDLMSKLSEKSLEIERLVKENELLKSERRKIEHEGLVKVSALTEESNKSGKRAEHAAEQLDASQVSNSELEAELRRLKVQSDQWRKAAEVATAMLSVNGKRVDYHAIGGKLGSENGGGETDDECGADEELGKNRRNGGNVLRK
ncbi:ROP interactive partner 4, partial [Striga asiatica]